MSLSRTAFCNNGEVLSTVSIMLFVMSPSDAVRVAVPSLSTVALLPSILTTLSLSEDQLTPFSVLIVKSYLTVAAVSAAAKKTGEAET